MHMYKHKYIRVHTYLRMYHHHHHHGAVRESAVSPTGTWNGMHECAHVLCGAPPFGGKETMPLGTMNFWGSKLPMKAAPVLPVAAGQQAAHLPRRGVGVTPKEHTTR